MYSVAVCDDDEIICSRFEHVLEPYILGKKIDLDVFYKGEDLIEVLSEGQHFDLIFLDIELCIMNGVEVGKYIRDKLGNENVQIVYISAKQQYAMELFETRPMNFLVKPISNESILEMLEKAMRLDGIYRSCFVFKSGSEIIRIPYGSIIYFESDNRKVTVYEENGCYKIYGKLSTIEKDAPQFFLRIHQSYLVNTNKIRRWRSDSVLMNDSLSLPVSQKYRKKVNCFLLNSEE